MTIISSKFKSATRAAVLAIVLGAGAMTAMPAQAQSAPAVNFSIDFGGGQGGAQFGTNSRGGGNWDRRPSRERDRLLSDRDIARGLRDYGFRNVEVRRDIGRGRVDVTGLYGRQLYTMRVDRRSGSVDRVQRVRSHPSNGFGLQFNFGR